MTKITASVEEQMSVLMRGVEYGDANIQRTMEEDLRELLSTGRPLRVYCGFDPTFTGLTLGNMVPMLKLRQFQRFGHDVTFLMGTMTAMIGDPTDKSAARPMLTAEEVEANSQSWLDQAFRVLDPELTTVRRNGDWLAPLSLKDVVGIASNFTVAQFLEHETFRKRMDEGKALYLHEFIYALMQAYDALNMKTDVQVGGTDQLFNIMAGRHLQRALGEKALVAVCTPLLIGTDGALKMSKSVGNSINLDLAPSDMYGKLMSIPDSLIVNYYTLLTDVPTPELHAIEKGLAERSLSPMETKKRLARSVVALLNDEAIADAAQQEFERVFQRREDPEDSAIEIPWGELPLASDLAVADHEARVHITRLISSKLDMSMSQSRRLLEDGAIAVDGQVVKTTPVTVRNGTMIRVGRHRFMRIVA